MANQISFSIYMAHGGTNFGLWAAAAQNPFRPLTTSYDYDAPVSESGQVTEKFTLIRAAIAASLAGRETLPPIPEPIPTITVPPIQFTEVSPVSETTTTAIPDESPRPMEAYDQGHGAILYRTELAPGPAGELKVQEVRDLAWVLLDGKTIGIFDRRNSSFAIPLPELKTKAILDIFVVAMGRSTSGQLELKGLIAPVTRGAGGSTEVKDWRIHRLPLDSPLLASLHYRPGSVTGPAFHRASFTLAAVGDTFLDTRHLGQGVLWINGRCLGRYWNIGPQQTLYCPGAWLKTGVNELVLLECSVIADPVVSGLSQPILNELHREKDFSVISYGK